MLFMLPVVKYHNIFKIICSFSERWNSSNVFSVGLWQSTGRRWKCTISTTMSRQIVFRFSACFVVLEVWTQTEWGTTRRFSRVTEISRWKSSFLKHLSSCMPEIFCCWNVSLWWRISLLHQRKRSSPTTMTIWKRKTCYWTRVTDVVEESMLDVVEEPMVDVVEEMETGDVNTGENWIQYGMEEFKRMIQEDFSANVYPYRPSIPPIVVNTDGFVFKNYRCK